MSTGGEVLQAGERRSSRIESVRAVAALAVLVSHAWLYAGGFGPGTVDDLGGRILAGGGLGVQLFFALSGYLIYRPFAQRDYGAGPTLDLRTYAWNRAVRILPLYLVAVVVLLIFTQDGGSVGQWWRFLLLVQNFDTATAQTVDPPMWSIAVELHFYLLLPLLALLLRRLCRTRARAVAVLVLLAIPSVVLRRLDPAPQVIWQYSLPATFFGFVPGMALALGSVRPHADRVHVEPWWRPGLLGSSDTWFAVAAAAWLVILNDYDLAVPGTAVAAFLTIGAVVLPLRTGVVARLLELRPLALVGVASYSLYIWHVPIIEQLPRSVRDDFGPLLVLSLIVSVSVAATSYALVERPALGLRRRWTGSLHDRSVEPGGRPTSALFDPLGRWLRTTPHRAWLAGILVIGFLVRARTIMATRPLGLGNDPFDYDRLGRLAADGIIFGSSAISPSGGATAFRAPLYPLFLGGVYRVTGDSITASRFLQALLGTVSILGLWWIAKRLFDDRVALVTAAIAAIHPPLVLATVALMSESIHLPLLVATTAFALRASDGPSPHRWAALSGACVGLAVLTRPNTLAALPALLLLLTGWRRRGGTSLRDGLGRAGVGLLAAAALVTPWVARNAVVLDAFVPVSTVDGYNLAGVYNDDSSAAAFPDRYRFRPPVAVEDLAPLFTDRSLDEVALGSELRAAGLEHLRANPTAPLEAGFWNSVRMLELTGFDESAAVASESGYGRASASVAAVAFWGLAVLAAVAFLDERVRRTPRALWAVPALLWASTVIFLGDARLRAPIEVYLILLAAVTATGLVDRAVAIARRGPWPGRSDVAVQPQPGGAEPFRLGFRPALEGVRGAAVALVVVFHLVSFLWQQAYLDGLLAGTFIGVDVFFVLSGFLITSLMLEEHRRSDTIALGAFYLRRSARLLPAVITLLAVAGAYVLLTGWDVGTHLRTTAMVLTYTSNWFIGANAELTEGFGHLWSLAIEEQFYLVWPLALLVLLRITGNDLRWLAIVIAVATAATAARRWQLLDSQGVWSRVYFRTDARIDQLLWGVLAAVALHAGWIRAAGARVAAGASILLLYLACTMSLFTSFYYRAGATIVAVSTVALLLASLDETSGAGRALAVPPLRWLGRISYALYLWHVPAIVVVSRATPSAPAVAHAVVALVMSILLAEASTRLVERRFRELKVRWERVPRVPAV